MAFPPLPQTGVQPRGTEQSCRSRAGSILGGPKGPEEAGKSPYDTSDGWAAHSFKEASDVLIGQGLGFRVEEGTSGRHFRRPSFPVIDYEPEHTGFGSSSQVPPPSPYQDASVAGGGSSHGS